MESNREVVIQQLIEAVGDSSRVLMTVKDVYSYAFDAYKPDIVCQPLASM